MLREADEKKLKVLAKKICKKRLQWFSDNYGKNVLEKRGLFDPIDEGYRVFLAKLNISAAEAPVVHREKNLLILHSRNFCPTLEACKILNLDTRFVCRHLTEEPTTELLRQVDSRLRFTRNYEKLRPYWDYCEEKIEIEG